MSFDEGVELGFQLIWNEEQHTWELIDTGQLLGPQAIHAELRAHAILTATRLDAVTANMMTGGLSIEAWQTTILSEIKSGHTADAIFGAGGIGNMTPEAITRVEATIAKESEFLAQFAQGVSDGTVSPLQARARAKQYSQAMEQSYWNEWRAGIDTPPAISNLPLLSQSPGDGSTQCHGNCQCILLFNADGSVEWSLNVAEHCADCVALAGGGPYRVS